VVYAKKPFAGPDEVLAYMARYTHRVAIANRRILQVRDEGTVRIEYRDYQAADADGRAPHRTLELTADEFIRRFLLHVLPAGFRKIRFYGILAGPERAAKLARCRELLACDAPCAGLPAPVDGDADRDLCPVCGRGHMRRVALLECERGPPVVVSFLAGSVVHAA